MFMQRAKELGTVILGCAVFLGSLALIAVFFRGSVWASDHLLQPLIAVGWIALGVDLLVLLPLSLFRSFRAFTGGAIFLSSYIFGLVAWLFGFIITYSLWGLFAVIIGISVMGVGVVPIALLAVAIKGYWEAFFMLIVLSIVTFGVRTAGAAIVATAPMTQR